MKQRWASQSPLRIHSNVLVQVKALVKDVVANHNDHEGCRSEAPPGNAVHQGDVVPEGEAQPDRPEPLVLLEVHESQKIACGSMLACATCSQTYWEGSPSVSIFSRDPLCKHTCRYCRCQPCDVGVEHDDHTCYSCE